MRNSHHRLPTGTVAGLALLALCLPAQLVAQGLEVDWQAGPGTMQLGDGVASLRLPEGYVFAGPRDTEELMRAMGNPPTGAEAGLVAPIDENKEWFIVFEYFPVGYVKDDDHGEIDAAALLESITRATDAANREREDMGELPLYVRGWFVEPHYDAQTHNLVWALEAQEEGELDRVVNYNVRVLGRKGYMSATLVTGKAQAAAEKAEIDRLLARFSYNEGNRYADFLPGDKVAKVGLAALVAGGAGVAAAKLGFFAVLAKFFGKAWKLLVLGVVAVGGVVKRFLGNVVGGASRRGARTLDSVG